MHTQVGIYSQLELSSAREVVRDLHRAIQGYRLYDGDHPTLRDVLLQLRKKWELATAGGPLSLRLTETQVLLDEEEVFKSNSRTDVLPNGLYDHGFGPNVVRQRPANESPPGGNATRRCSATISPRIAARAVSSAIDSRVSSQTR